MAPHLSAKSVRSRTRRGGDRPATVLRSSTLADGRTADVEIRDGAIVAVHAVGADRSDGGGEDLSGYLLLPSLIEPHTHLDKAFTMDMVASPRANLASAVAAWLDFRRTLSVDDVLEKARPAAMQFLAYGCTAIRSHVDVGEGIELRALEALSVLRQELSGAVHLELVALPTVPLTGRAGADNRAILRSALEAGADLVGGGPHRDPDPRGYLHTCLDLALEHSLPVDFHMDETLDETSLWVQELCSMVSGGFPHRVTASHCVSLGIQPPAIQLEVARSLAMAGISVVTCPITNLYLHGRESLTSPPRALTALGALTSAGVTVAAGGDNVQDLFNPLGRCDPFVTAGFLVAAGYFSPSAAYEAVSKHARIVMGLDRVEVAPGCRADLVAIAGSSLSQAVARATEDRWVWSAGDLVGRTTITQTP